MPGQSRQGYLTAGYDNISQFLTSWFHSKTTWQSLVQIRDQYGLDKQHGIWISGLHNRHILFVASSYLIQAGEEDPWAICKPASRTGKGCYSIIKGIQVRWMR